MKNCVGFLMLKSITAATSKYFDALSLSNYSLTFCHRRVKLATANAKTRLMLDLKLSEDVSPRHAWEDSVDGDFEVEIATFSLDGIVDLLE
jgi:hypothetical protein